MTTNPYITPLPQQQAQQGPSFAPPPLPGLNQVGTGMQPKSEASIHWNQVRNDFKPVFEDFRAMPPGPEKHVERPLFEMQRDYRNDTQDWFEGLDPSANPALWPSAPKMPLQINPTFKGFPGPYPGDAPNLSPNLNAQQRTMARISQLPLPPHVLQRLMATLSGTGQTATPPVTPTTPDRDRTPTRPRG